MLHSEHNNPRVITVIAWFWLVFNNIERANILNQHGLSKQSVSITWIVSMYHWKCWVRGGHGIPWKSVLVGNGLNDHRIHQEGYLSKTRSQYWYLFLQPDINTTGYNAVLLWKTLYWYLLKMMLTMGSDKKNCSCSESANPKTSKQTKQNKKTVQPVEKKVIQLSSFTGWKVSTKLTP